MAKLTRTIIISPTYNELDNAQILIPALFFNLPEVSLMIVDDASPDGTSLEIEKMQKHFPNLLLFKRSDKRGFGSAYKEAYQRVLNDDRFDFVVSMDADFSHDFREIPKMVDELNENDFVIGSRYIDRGGVENWSLRRRILSKFANWYVRTILGHRINDMTTGFTCFRKEILKTTTIDEIFSHGYSFLVEFKHLVIISDYKVKEHPIVYRERRVGRSKMSVKVILESILLPWKLKYR
jgi:dolichol-phosphate mannosyltransferase